MVELASKNMVADSLNMVELASKNMVADSLNMVELASLSMVVDRLVHFMHVGTDMKWLDDSRSIEIWSANLTNFKAPIMSCVLMLGRSSRVQIFCFSLINI